MLTALRELIHQVFLKVLTRTGGGFVGDVGMTRRTLSWYSPFRIKVPPDIVVVAISVLFWTLNVGEGSGWRAV